MAEIFSRLFIILAALAGAAWLCGYRGGLALMSVLLLTAMLTLVIKPKPMTESELRTNGVNFDR